MKIVIAPDPFKGSLSAGKCCRAIKVGFSTIFPNAYYIYLPIADGDGGTAEAVAAVTSGNIVTLEVYGPMGETVNASYGLTGDGKTAMIEMTAASGLMLVAPKKRNLLLASSFDTGELIRRALDNGIHHIILGVGGSTTVDDGMGMAQALGVCFLDTDGQVLAANGGNLARVASIEMDRCDPRPANCHIEATCDVDNPLVGARDVAAMFGPQKGATLEMVGGLGQGLQNYAHVLQQRTEINVCQMVDGSAAGGMGIAAVVFLSVNTRPDIEIMLNAISLAQVVQDAALVITEEGHINSQTTGDKAPLGVASVAKQFNVPVIGTADVLGGSMEVVHQYGVDAVFSVSPRLTPLTEMLANDEANLFDSARSIACTIKIGQGIKN